jgi:tRNA-modifying protein YgfZ
MVFWSAVELADVTDDLAVVWRPGPTGWSGGSYAFVPRAELAGIAGSGADVAPAGLWAFEALRVEAGVPRLGFETDHRTIPHEVGWIGPAVHLEKGCYRGQETVARVQNLGRPPRRLVRLHLDGSKGRLPPPGTPLTLDGRAVGFVGTAVQHFELGPVALGLVKRKVPEDAELVAVPAEETGLAPIAAAQDAVVPA